MFHIDAFTGLFSPYIHFSDLCLRKSLKLFWNVLYTTVRCISNTSFWCTYGIYVLVIPYFPKSLMIRSLVPRSFTYHELKYEPRTSVTSGISTNLYEVVSLVPKRPFFSGCIIPICRICYILNSKKRIHNQSRWWSFVRFF